MPRILDELVIHGHKKSKKMPNGKNRNKKESKQELAFL